MTDIESKLNKFRAQNEQIKPNTSVKFDYHLFIRFFENLGSFFPSKQEKTEKKNENLTKSETEPNKDEHQFQANPKLKRLIVRDSVRNQAKIPSCLDKEETEEKTDSAEFRIKVIQIALKFLLWLILFFIFLKLEFAAVYFVISLLVIIYLNTRVSKSKNGQLSAYSVFNPNVERISGTITPEKLQQHLF